MGWSGDKEVAARAEVERLANQKRLRRLADEAEAERLKKTEAEHDRAARRKLEIRAKNFEAAARRKTAEVRMWHVRYVGCVFEEVVTVEVVSFRSEIDCQPCQW